MSDEPELIPLGNFGYEEFNDQFIVPYTFRKREKYCASNIFWWHFKKQNVKLSANLIDFGYLTSYQMNGEEVRLWSEINEWHNNSMYSKYSFTPTDTLINMKDVRAIAQYLEDCGNKLKLNTQYKMNQSTFSGMAQIQLHKSKPNIILPYVVKNSQRYVPAKILFTKDTLPKTLEVAKLIGIDVMYMRFLFDILKINNISSKNFKLSCVQLDQLVAHLVSNESGYYQYDDDYWPSKKDNHHKVNNTIKLPLFTSTCNNNNMLDQPKVSVKQMKSNSTSTVVSMTKTEEPTVASRKRKNDEPLEPKKGNKEPKISNKKPDETDDELYDVEEILDYKRQKNGTEMVLIRWKGYSSGDDSWEPIDSLNDALDDDVNKLREKWARKASANKQ